MMQSNFSLISAVRRGFWALEAEELERMHPTADALLRGEGLALLQSSGNAEQHANEIQCATMGPQGASTFRMSWYADLDEVAPGSIAIIELQGLVMKGYSCYGGSMARAQQVLDAAAHPNVAGILINCDTRGGQADGLNTVHDAILRARTEFNCPVLLLVNDGSCASAGYHTASACTEIWATHSTCQIGSIGALTMLRDSTEAEAKAGNKTMVVYATKSTRKNGTYRDALNGDLTALVAELDFLNDDFHARVLAQRPDLTDEELNGDMFNAQEGLQRKLIDRIGSYEEALNHLLELAGEAGPQPGTGTHIISNDFNFSSNPTPPSTMKFAAICALLGFQALETKDQHASFSEAHLQAIENALEERTTQATQLSALNGQLTTANTNLAARTTELSTATGRIGDLEKKLLEAPSGEGIKLTGQDKEPEPERQLSAWQKLDQDMLLEAQRQRKAFGYDE